MEEEESETAIEGETEQEPEEKISARPYQVELLERAKERNTIVCLGTGTGKTFISVMLIKELAHQVRGTYKKGGKRTFFLVNTVPLASQQAKVIDEHTDLKVKHYVGEMGVDFWDKPTWEREFNKSNVLVMTAQIFLDLLHHSYIRLSQVNLLIFDECHHAKKNDPYKQIMQFFDCCPRDAHPKVMGLTASIVNGKVKPWKIESEIKELECTLRATCETSQDENVEKFAAKPKEEVLTFSNQTIDEDTNLLITILTDVLRPGIDFLYDCRVSSKDYLVKNAHWYAKFALRECQDTLRELGPWAACEVAECLIKDLDRACMFQDSRDGRMFCEFSATQLRQLQGVYRNFTSTTCSDGGEDNGRCYIMPKLQKLLSVLRESKCSLSKDPSEENLLCGIVFVERRYTALVLSKQINIAAKLDPELTSVKSNYVIGHGTGAKVNYSSYTEMNFKKQEEVLRKFRKREFNLLIATSVVEEGLDIPKCNVVCRFDFPKNFRSYVQSKGRARKKDSRYYMLVDEETEMEARGELEMLREIEKTLLGMCHDRIEPTEEECNEAVDTDFIPAYIPSKGEGPRVTMSSSISLLSRYCSKLPGDRFTHPKPLYKVEECGKDYYICKLQLPINCPLRENILSPPMPRKNLAKMAAALYACEELHKKGELDDNLLPVCTLSDEESESEEEEGEPGGKKKVKAGTKKRRRRYGRKIPDVFIGSLVQKGQPHFLTVITIRVTKLTRPQELVVSEAMFRDQTCRFGMLTNKRLPTMRSFKLYPNYGEVTVSLSCEESPTRCVDFATVRNFHCHLFTHVLRVPVEVKPESADGYFIVLVKGKDGRRIDFDRMKDELSRNVAIEEDVVVIKNYGQDRQRYAVLRVRRDLNPLTPFPDKSKGTTYEQYFRKTYGACVTNMKQPLIEARQISGRVNFLVDRKPTGKSKRDVISLIPELCNLLPVCSSLLCAAQILPSVLQRVSSLLVVADVKAIVAGERDDIDESNLPAIGARDANDEKKLLGTDQRSEEEEEEVMEVDDDDDTDQEFPGLNADLKSMFRGSSECSDHPDSALVLQALTTTHSGDALNLERLEMLGDAFLKLAVSLHLFCTYRDKDEGKLTRRKKNQISNLALFRAAAKKSLAEYLQSTQLARDVWCPTGCQFGYIPQDNESATGDAAMEVDNETTGAGEVEMEVDDVQERGAGGKIGKEASRASDTKQVNPDGKGEERKLSATERARQKCNTQTIADKSVADSVEALIGAYLISCGYLGALKFMSFLGLKVLPDADGDSDPFEEDTKPGCYATFWSDQGNGQKPQDKGDLVSRMISGLGNFEKQSINYTFKSKLHLLEALTHASYHPNRVTTSYERLEFLGDALLDFLVTQHLYFRHAKLTPGQLTDIRQALVNNNIFATIAVKNDYHKYLKQMSPQWFKTVENFINRLEDEAAERKDQGNHSQTVITDPFIFVSQEDEEGIEAPKVLADIFESVAGAVFLDSGMDLTKIWGVYYRMMKPYIDHYSVNIPLNPIRRVYEEDENADFGKAEPLGDGKISRTLRVRWGEFVGKGANSRIAKATSAKFAMEALNANVQD